MGTLWTYPRLRSFSDADGYRGRPPSVAVGYSCPRLPSAHPGLGTPRAYIVASSGLLNCAHLPRRDRAAASFPGPMPGKTGTLDHGRAASFAVPRCGRLL